MTTTTIGTRQSLKTLRITHGLSQSDLSELSGISTGTIVRIENKQSTGIHQGVAWSLADALGVSMSDIDWPADLTHRGRPPKTGRPLTLTVHHPVDSCNACFIMKSVAGECWCAA